MKKILITALLLAACGIANAAEQVDRYRIYCNDCEGYVYEWGQTTPSDCPNNAAHSINVESITIVDTVKSNDVSVKYYAGEGPQMFIQGYKFTASASSTTVYNFNIPVQAGIQGGDLGGEINTGDCVSFVIFPGEDYERTYISEYALTADKLFVFDEKYGSSAILPQYTPVRVVYENTGVSDITVCFNLIFRLPEE